ncbi:5'-3' exoribonuclease [Gracilaria domingensis]|nr:5'-3' exoribonuclease [Gracilaria domingensis]
MGILGFQKWFLGTFPEVVRVQQGPRFGEVYDHVAFDINQILHQVLRRATNRQTLAAAIFRELDQILKNCVPRKSIFFAFDGPAPVAKLTTQRRRRRKKTADYVSDYVDENGVLRKPKFAKAAIDSLEMTPGVETLYFVRDSVEYWAYSRLQNDRKYRSVDIRISGADVPGEGELKLVDYCRTGKFLATDSVVVVGGDADIVLQGLTTIPIRNFFVYLRNFAGFKGKRQSYVISVWELARTFERIFPNESSSVRLDFVLLTILNGNDYIPKVRGISLRNTWRRYMSLKLVSKDGDLPPFHGQSLVDAEKRTLNWPMFYALMGSVGVPVPSIAEAEQEKRLGTRIPLGTRKPKSKQGYMSLSDSEAEEHIVYTGNEDGIPMDCLDDSSNSEGIESAASDGSTTDSEDTEEEYAEEEDEEYFDEEQEHIQTLIALSGNSTKFYDTSRWARALLWNLHMYVDGICGDYNFLYGKPYGPPIEEILKYIRDHDGDPFLLQAPISRSRPLFPHEAAMAVLPKTAKHLLPNPLQRMYDNPNVLKKIFSGKDGVDVASMTAEISRIPKSDFSSEELRRTVFGSPILLRLPRPNDRVEHMNPRVKKPGQRFEDVRSRPAIYRASFTMTTIPPCYDWPKGSIPNMLELSYKTVRGSKLKARKKVPAESNGSARKASSKPQRRTHRRTKNVRTRIASSDRSHDSLKKAQC